MMKCIRMLTFLPLEQIEEMDGWKDAKLNEAKEILAFELTKLVHGEEEAASARDKARAISAAAAPSTSRRRRSPRQISRTARQT